MTTKLFDLEGKIALVSGASRGIGEEIAKLLADQGAHVIVSSRKAEDCQRVADAIRDAGGRASVLACNVGKMEDIAAAFEQIEKLHGRLDILINNAAANPYYGHVLDTDLAAFTKTVDVNIRGYFFMSVEAGKMMRKQGKGAIVNVASVNAHKEISMIKALVPGVYTAVCDRAMQTFGAMGISPDTPLADMWTWGRALRFADGPDEVHLQNIARMEVKKGQENLGATVPYLLTEERG